MSAPGRIGGSNKMVDMYEAASYVGATVGTFRQRYKIWGIPSYRIGRRVMFRERDLESYLESCRVEA